ncbi:LacI family DNA-binding transcriptional regulator [uncultured Clostridium sp.]|uniref:LacI family DNA-binding transcriptional regulator n=1 Tax=uncultured Clostridium sp. TaxID=59620 RepID=UPI00262F11C2|nr:LacI family DNA-binding transcriptional regulator [uncultured Clostridium sp.]
MATSIKDVAREAGVSIATVSRVLNEIDVVNEDTKKKVQEAIKMLGYRPNIVARSLKTQRTKTIGIIVPDISSQVYPEIVRGAEDVANIYKYNVMLCNSDCDGEKELEYLRVLKEKMVDGVLYMSSSLGEEILDLINELNIKIILVETGNKESGLPSVSIDNIAGAYEATNHLLEKGRKNIAFMGTSKNEKNAWGMRFEGYEKALNEAGIEVKEELCFFENLKIKTGKDGVAQILDNGYKVDGIVCASDEIAIGAINALRENNLNVPADVSVTGFNGIDMAKNFYPTITTVEQPMYDMGSVAMRMLIKLLNNQELDNANYELPHTLIEGGSC